MASKGITRTNRFSFSRVEPELDVDQLAARLLQLLQQDRLSQLQGPDFTIEFFLLTFDLRQRTGRNIVEFMSFVYVLTLQFTDKVERQCKQ